MSGCCVEHPPDALAAQIAARQHGLVTVGQLSAVGITRRGIAHRVAHGRLVAKHRGVYVLGPLTDAHTDAMAAVLACGLTAALSDWAAAALQGFGPQTRGAVEVTVTEGQPRSRPGIHVRRRALAPDERTVVEGVPVTTPARTIRDLAATTDRRALGRLIEEARVQRKLDGRALAEAVERAAGRPGAAVLRAAVAEATRDPQLTRSEAERRLLALIRDGQLPAPRTNVRLGRHEVDVLWPAERLVVEVDGFAFHGTRAAFERDRRRDAELTARGFRVIRVTWRQLLEESHAVVARLAAALAAR